MSVYQYKSEGKWDERLDERGGRNRIKILDSVRVEEGRKN